MGTKKAIENADKITDLNQEIAILQKERTRMLEAIETRAVRILYNILVGK